MDGPDHDGEDSSGDTGDLSPAEWLAGRWRSRGRHRRVHPLAVVSLGIFGSVTLSGTDAVLRAVLNTRALGLPPVSGRIYEAAASVASPILVLMLLVGTSLAWLWGRLEQGGQRPARAGFGWWSLGLSLAMTAAALISGITQTGYPDPTYSVVLDTAAVALPSLAAMAVAAGVLRSSRRPLSAFGRSGPASVVTGLPMS